MCNEIHDRLAALERRVGATEAAVILPGNLDISGSIGEAVAANGQAIRQAMVQLRDKAGKDELAAKSEELEACVRERERAVRKWGVGREFADGLGRVQRGLAEQLSAFQGMLATKLDRAEFDNMEAVCAKVSTVSEFLEETTQRVSKLEAGLNAAERERRQHEAEIEEDVKGLQAEIDVKADAQPSREFARDLAELQKAFSEETLSKRRQLRALKHETLDLQKTVSSLNSSCDERLSTIEACLQGAATKQELAKKADGSDVEKSLRALRDDCTLRAKQSSLSELQSAVSSLETEHAKTKKASDIATRFVDWFSTRGQAYEHNLTAVEKHIENLAIRSVGSRVSPAGALDAAQRTRVGLRSDGGLGFLGPGGGREGGETLGGRRVPYGGNIRFTPS